MQRVPTHAEACVRCHLVAGARRRPRRVGRLQARPACLELHVGRLEEALRAQLLLRPEGDAAPAQALAQQRLALQACARAGAHERVTTLPLTSLYEARASSLVINYEDFQRPTVGLFSRGGAGALMARSHGQVTPAAEGHAASTRDVAHGVRVRREDGVLLARTHDVPARAFQQQRARRRRANARRAGRAGCPRGGQRGGVGTRRARERRQQRRPPQRLRHLLRCGAGARSAEGGARLARGSRGPRQLSPRRRLRRSDCLQMFGGWSASAPVCQHVGRAPGARARRTARGTPSGAASSRRRSSSTGGQSAAAASSSRSPPPAYLLAYSKRLR